jgi:hypothetical protein
LHTGVKLDPPAISTSTGNFAFGDEMFWHLSPFTGELRLFIELLTSSGQSVFTAQSLKPVDPEGRRIEFDVPARVLKAGDYQVRLSVGDGSREGAARYYFRVQ